MSEAGANAPLSPLPILSINPLLKALRPSNVDVPEVGAAEIALAVSNIFTNQLSTGTRIGLDVVSCEAKKANAITSSGSSPSLQPLSYRS